MFVRQTAQSDGPRLTLSEAVSQAARSVGVTPITSPSALQEDLERPELQEAYAQQVQCPVMELPINVDQRLSSKLEEENRIIFLYILFTGFACNIIQKL